MDGYEDKNNYLHYGNTVRILDRTLNKHGVRRISWNNERLRSTLIKNKNDRREQIHKMNKRNEKCNSKQSKFL